MADKNDESAYSRYGTEKEMSGGSHLATFDLDSFGVCSLAR